MKLSITPKRWLKTCHILFAAIMLGNMVTFLLLSITIAISENGQLIESSYQVMHLLSKTSVKASTFGTIITGILLSIWTKWGLFKFYWIIAKELLTIPVFALNLWGMYYWTLQAFKLIESSGARTDVFIVQAELWIGIIIQLISLLLMFGLSVFKPWGRRTTVSK
ncbi:hypothetical protein [Virgibacillus litoralis]|uniref:Membrane protein n=1 Tax=Virgibacillus litoralis TaxID=578221 RepID=A0ABS4HDT2_9BACI|nr:hypothetical protein [Virgibacillus litoralis]MBP1949076.1 putative membrane protein [Virgibacillus litoralis]